MSNIDVAAFAAELAPLVQGARVDRAYQPAKDRILLRLRKTGAGRTDLLFELGRFIIATKRPPENPDKPSMLATVLRNELENGRVTVVRQLGFDRILWLTIERGDGIRHLVFELFGDGNLLLLDADKRIKLPMRGEDYAARSLRKGEPYQSPPASPDPFQMDVLTMRAAAAAGTHKDLVRWLALGLGFGPLWGEEICLRAGIDKRLLPAALDDLQWGQLHRTIRDLGNDVRGNLLAPHLVYAAPTTAATTAETASSRTTAPPSTPETTTSTTTTLHTTPTAPAATTTPTTTTSATPTSPSTPPGDAEATLVDAVPFAMLRYPQPGFVHEEAPSFREALDAFFIGAAPEEGEEELEDPRRPRFDEARGKLQRQVDQTRDAAVKFLEEEAEAMADGHAMYGAFPLLQDILTTLDRERQARGWAAIEEGLAAGRKAGNALARRIVEVRPHEASARIELPTEDGAGPPRVVEVDLRLNVQENAEAAYAVAKKARSRREGAQQAQREAEARVRALEAKGLDGFGAAPVRAPAARHHYWFEAYRWTVTPSGLVAVGGRNASQNDAVVKKYLRDGDRYVHADIHGAPSVVVRPYDAPAGDVAPEDLRAAAQFAAMASRAWRLGASASAYWVTAQQVSKTPRSGEFVPRGAWIIHGRRNVEDRLPMEWWIGPLHLTTNGIPIRAEALATHAGRSVRKLAGGPREGLAPFGAAVVHMVPGTEDPNEVAQRIAQRFGCTPEEAQAALPSGPVRVVSGLEVRPAQDASGGAA